ncbi:hypothetical protein [Nocardioides sp.]|uniref:NADase-type glycan-binding domain-containing protein n=1 Tax=Nocardioides sp. TaxID=35761 RepID=UPI00351265B9
MSSPSFCEACGHLLGIGRFCTNCGRPVPGRHPEAGPPAGVPGTFHPGSTPPPARYPLYADEPTAPPAPVDPAPARTDEADLLPGIGRTGGADAPPPGGRRRPWLPWVAGGTAVAVLAGLGAVLLAGGDDGEEADSARDRASSSSTASATDDGSSAGPEGADSDDPGDDASDVAAPDPDDIVDVTPGVRARVPGTAPASRDSKGRPVTFRARNMWDGDARTCWRTAGDASGQTITFRLPEDTVLTEVGLLNGYAKVDGPNDWYPSNRRVLKVSWEFDDGRTVTQDLTERRTLQSLPIDPVETSRVRLRLLEVSAPGEGSRGRDFTAISEVRLLGAPA